MFMNCIDSSCTFVFLIDIKMRIGLFPNFSSEAEHVLALFLFLGKSILRVLVKCFLIPFIVPMLRRFHSSFLINTLYSGKLSCHR